MSIQYNNVINALLQDENIRSAEYNVDHNIITVVPRGNFISLYDVFENFTDGGNAHLVYVKGVYFKVVDFERYNTLYYFIDLKEVIL